jgi:2,3,4,5-tetrahydropyridine-2-carboxylate N-succinyltransferase
MAGAATQYFDKVPGKFARYTREDFVRGGFRVVPPAMARRGAYGLMGIRERAQLFGGSMNVESGENEGTRLEVVLPLDGTPNWDLFEPEPVSSEPTLSPV